MKNSSTSTWILILIAIGLLVVAWYMSVTKNVLTPADTTDNIVIQDAQPVTSQVQRPVESAAQSVTQVQQNSTLDEQTQDTNAQGAGEILQIAAEYEGTLPCADCPGIITTLTLYPNQTYQLDTVYIDRDSSFTSKGSWKYDTNPPRYVLLDDKQQYQILADDTLQAMDMNGNPIDSSLNYTLTRVSVTQQD